MGKLAADQLTLSYDSTVIIDGVDLKIEEGKITALIGANGCGKSTILKSLARLMAPKSGTVYWKERYTPPAVKRSRKKTGHSSSISSGA